MLREIIGDLPIVPDNHKFLAKFHSGILRITDPMRLMSLFQLLLEHLFEFVLISSLGHLHMILAQRLKPPTILLTLYSDFFNRSSSPTASERRFLIRSLDHPRMILGQRLEPPTTA